MIELVVKLPEQAYEVIKRNDVGIYAHNLALLTKWIANGKVIPKGHGRVIDFVDAFGMYIGWAKKRCGYYRKIDAELEVL